MECTSAAESRSNSRNSIAAPKALRHPKAGNFRLFADLGSALQLHGAEAIFVGRGIFMKDSITFADPVEAEKRARAIVKAATHFNDPKVLLEVSEDLAGAMKGLAVAGMDEAQMLQTRGW
jgi:pyridoxal 5'-phosphate synthase pdxS subunit